MEYIRLCRLAENRPQNREIEYAKTNTQRDKSQSVIDTSERCSSTTILVSDQSPGRCLGAIALILVGMKGDRVLVIQAVSVTLDLPIQLPHPRDLLSRRDG